VCFAYEIKGLVCRAHQVFLLDICHPMP